MSLIRSSTECDYISTINYLHSGQPPINYITYSSAVTGFIIYFT